MIYVKRRPFRRRPKDILNLALKNLWPGEELLCTVQAYRNIKDRLDVIAKTWPDRKIGVIPSGPIMKLRRVA